MMKGVWKRNIFYWMWIVDCICKTYWSSWGAEFQTKRNLGFVKSDELLNVYNRMDKIKEDYLYDGSIGTESELSDEIVIWMYEIMKLRKTLIEIEKIKYE